MGSAPGRPAQLGGHDGNRRRAAVHRQVDGEFLALDKDTGKTLWQFQTGSSVNATAITYTHKGRQYLTVASGLGGILATRYASRKVPAGGSVWTFALPAE